MKGRYVTKVKIPGTVALAVEALTEIEGLLTAKQWTRAAIVYAFTTDGKPGPKTDRSGSGPISLAEFARLGIMGLEGSSPKRYRRIWQNAVDAGHAQPAEPGKLIEVPTVDWSEAYGAVDNIREREGDLSAKRFMDKATPERKAEVARELVRDPEIARAVAEEPTARRAVTEHYNEQRTATEQRSERITASDPVERKIDHERALLDLGRLCDHFAHDVADALGRLGELPEDRRYWLNLSAGRSREAQEAIDRYIERGRTDVDEFIKSVLAGD